MSVGTASPGPLRFYYTCRYFGGSKVIGRDACNWEPDWLGLLTLNVGRSRERFLFLFH